MASFAKIKQRLSNNSDAADALSELSQIYNNDSNWNSNRWWSYNITNNNIF